MAFSDETIREFREFLTPKGQDFFREWIKRHGHGWQTAVQAGSGAVPRNVHFQEGMHIRNWMRGRDEFKHWDPQGFDDGWHRLVEAALTKRQGSG